MDDLRGKRRKGDEKQINDCRRRVPAQRFGFGPVGFIASPEKCQQDYVANFMRILPFKFTPGVANDNRF